MAKQEIVMIPTPAPGHMVSVLEFAKLLIHGADNPFSVTILVIKPPHEPPTAVSQFTHLAGGSHPNIRFIQLPKVDLPPPELTDSVEKFISVFIESHKSLVKDAIIDHLVSKSISIAGVIVDMFCTSMIDVANEFGVPSYVFFTSGASLLGLLLYLPIHKSKTGRDFFIDSDPDSIIPSFSNPVPSRFLPSFTFSKDGCSSFLSHVRKFKEAKGIIVNTFAELEAISSIESELETTKVYPIGPLIKKGEPKGHKIINWLDEQAPSSVIFLCFGSKGGFHPPQLAEIATALENSGQRFLWAIQKPPSMDFSKPLSREYNDFSEVLPDGFLERTKNRGLVCGWAPQVEVLSHESVGGFVSHCGWNSILESIWNGVPIAAWPVYAEQQINAFQLVKDLGIAVEVKLDYRIENADLIVPNDEIEKAITSLMNKENPVRKKVEELSDLSRQAWLVGGSSFKSMERFVADVLANTLS